jgi:CheY-like chemotaxis protein
MTRVGSPIARADPIEAADGAQALDVLQSAAQIDLRISDVGLPGGLNGRQFADAGRLLRPSLRVLFITGYAEDALVGHAGLGPGMHVLTKPFTLETLATRIKELTAQPEHTGPESLPTV